MSAFAIPCVLPRFLRCFESVTARRERITTELASLRARKRSYLSQLDAIDAHFSPSDAAACITRERLLDLIAEAVRRELDLLDALDALH